jgi:hypothetical protein
VKEWIVSEVGTSVAGLGKSLMSISNYESIGAFSEVHHR